MSDAHKPQIGSIAWHDLTVDNAEEVRDFYAAVAGWRPEAVDMGGYADFSMLPAGSESPAAGICHARESNADLPPQWLMYIVVADVDEAAETCRERGGKVLVEPRRLGSSRFCVIRDPAGAVCALYQAGG